MASPADMGGAPQRERIFNAPWPPLLIAALLPVLFFLQIRHPDEAGLIYRYGFLPSDLAAGRVDGLITHMFLHGSWAHVGMNAIGALAFGAPVARWLGRPGVGALGFFAFYLLCGAIAAGGYGLLHADSPAPLIGASGGVFALIGGATRLMGSRGRLAPPWARPVLMASAAWIGVNLFIGLTGFAPGAEGASVAWEAHIIGFVAGLLLIGPWTAMFGAPPSRIDSPAGLGDAP